MKQTCIAAAIAIALGGCASTNSGTTSKAGLDRIDTIVVIYAENHSFDNMYGLFPARTA